MATQVLTLEEVLANDVGRIGFFRKLHRAHLGRKILHTVHDIAHSPFVKAIGAGLTFVIPPAGAAVTAALVAVDKGTQAIDDARHKAAAISRAVQHSAAPPHPNAPPPAVPHPAAPVAVASKVVVRTEPMHPGIHAVGNGGVAIAERLVAAHAYGDAKVRAAVAGVYKRTTAAAKAGDADAKRALVVLAAAKKKLDALRHYTYHVDTKGKVTRGAFKALPAGHKGMRGYFVRADGHVQSGTFAHA